MTNSGDNRSVNARDITSSSVVTGDSNTVTTTVTQHTLPPPESINAKEELAALREALGKLNVPDRKNLDRALETIKDETEKPAPNKQEAADAATRIVRYAKQAEDFSDHAEKLIPRLTALAAWLAPAGRTILSVLGITP